MTKQKKKVGRWQVNFKGLWLPAEIFNDDRLSPTEIILVMLIHSYDSSDKPEGKACYITNPEFADTLNVATRTVRNAINRLCDLKYIRSEVDKPAGNVRYLYSQMVVDMKGKKKQLPTAKNAIGSKEKSAQGLGQKSLDPTAKNAIGLYKEDNTDNTGGDNTPTPEEISNKSYLMARGNCRGLPEPFFEFFETHVLGRWNKYEVTTAILKDWHDVVYIKNDTPDIVEAIRKHKAEHKGWQPKWDQIVKLVRATVNEKKKNEQRKQIAKQEQVEQKSIEQMNREIAENDPEKFVKMFNMDFGRAQRKQNQYLQELFEQAEKALEQLVT
jgi:helix-turn-helix protein